MSSLPTNTKRTCLLCGLLLACGTLVYLPSIPAPFLFDDAGIAEKESIRSLSALGPELMCSRRAVVSVSLWLNYTLGELDVRGYHVFNLLVHLTAGLALFGIVARALKLPVLEEKYAKSADLIALAVALVWLVHPLQTQAVTYTIQRCESMMGMFYLLCLYCVLRGSQSPRAWPWYAGGLIAGWLGMGCKEVMITAPVVILLFDRVFLSPSWKTVLRSRWVFYLGFAPPVVWLLANTIGAEAPTAGFGYELISPWEYLRSQPGVILHYLRLAAFPDQLCLDYKWPVAQTWSAIVLPGAAVTALLAASLLALRYRPPLGFLGLSFFLILAPTSSIMPIADLAFEHRMYLPLAPLMVLSVIGCRELIGALATSRRSRHAALVATLVLVAGMLMVRTTVRNALYLRPVVIWAHVIAVAPHNDRAHFNYGNRLAHHGRKDEAIASFRKAIELNPEHVDARLDLATALARRAQSGDVEEAIGQYRRALQSNPEIHAAHYNLGILLDGRGKLEEALVHFRRAVEIKPDRDNYQRMLGETTERCGKQT